MAAENRALKKELKKFLTRASAYATVEIVDTLTEWRRKGGRATAKKLTPAQRSASARKAVLARWSRRTDTKTGTIGGEPSEKR